MNRLILGTGNYNNVKSGNSLSISGDKGLSFGYHGNYYRELAPRLDTYNSYNDVYQLMKNNILEYEHYEILKEQIEEKYIRSYYETRLKDLDIDKLLNTLEEKYGKDIILLCYEDINQFCHRRIIADYIELMTGFYIPEIEVNEKGKVKELTPIRYKEQLKKIIK